MNEHNEIKKRPPVWVSTAVATGVCLAALVAWKIRQNRVFFGLSHSGAAAINGLPVERLPLGGGGELELASLRGEPMVIHFWASWCAPCLVELPELVKATHFFDAHAKEKKVRWIFINRDENFSDAEKFIPHGERGTWVYWAHDRDGSISEKFGTFQFPETYLINTRGEIVKKWIGVQTWDAADLGEKRREIDGLAL